MKNLSTQRGIVHIVPLLVVLVIVGGAIWFFLTNKGGLETERMTVPIDPSQLMPLVSAQEARITFVTLKRRSYLPKSARVSLILSVKKMLKK